MDLMSQKLNLSQAPLSVLEHRRGALLERYKKMRDAFIAIRDNPTNDEQKRRHAKARVEEVQRKVDELLAVKLKIKDRQK